MIVSSTTYKIFVSLVSILGICTFYFQVHIAIAILLAALGLYIFNSRNANKPINDREFVTFLHFFIADYKKTRSLQFSLKNALKQGFSFNGRLKRALNVYRLGGIPEQKYKDGLDKFIDILYRDYQKGISVLGSLEFFAKHVEKGIEKINNESRFSSGMKMIAQAGISLFFPLFGGISAGILNFISKFPSALALENKFSLIVIGYIVMIAFLHSLFYKSDHTLLDVTYNSVPYFSIGLVIFALSVSLINEVV